MIYLASPYSHPDPEVREQRFVAACRATAELIRAGNVVFSPIVHSHSLAAFGLPTDWTSWEPHDREYLARVDEVVVMMIDGWQESVGVQAEIRIATDAGVPMRYAEMADLCSPTLAHVRAREAR